MTKKRTSKLELSRETVRELSTGEMDRVAGGVTPVTGLCMYSLYVQCLTGNCPKAD
jgi:hypothetical protein